MNNKGGLEKSGVVYLPWIGIEKLRKKKKDYIKNSLKNFFTNFLQLNLEWFHDLLRSSYMNNRMNYFSFITPENENTIDNNNMQNLKSSFNNWYVFTIQY